LANGDASRLYSLSARTLAAADDRFGKCQRDLEPIGYLVAETLERIADRRAA
jgi:hypothetical protein